MNSPLDEPLADLGWSLWSELGVPGVVRRHQHVAVDLEPLVLLTPWLARADARLHQEALRWCRSHRRWVSQSRLKALLKATSAEASETLRPFLAELVQPLAREERPPTLRLQRPSLVQLRLRALCGVGARADVLGQLLAHRSQPVTASRLAWLGYTKRAVAGILSDLDEGGLAHARADGNQLAYSLTQPQQLTELVQAQGLAWIDWRRVFLLLYEIDTLLAQSHKPAPVRRVAATTSRDVMDGLADRLGLPRPPVAAGDREAWERLTQWALAQAHTLSRTE